MNKMIVLFLNFPDIDKDEEANEIAEGMIEWAKREREVLGGDQSLFTVQAVVIDA